MKDHAFLQSQAVQLRHLVETSENDPLLTPQLQERLEAVETELAAVSQMNGELFIEDFEIPRIAVFVMGANVQSAHSIRASLAGEALIQMERMFVGQAVHDERQAVRGTGRQRRPRGAAIPELLLCGTPRGSFGLEFVPKGSDDKSLMSVHGQSLHKVAEWLSRFAEYSSTDIESLISEVPSCVIRPMKQFFTVMANYGAELRIAYPEGESKILTGERIKAASEKLARGVEVNEQTLEGIFRGVTRETVVFDLLTAENRVLTGTLADDLTEEDVERIDELTNKKCIVRLQQTIIKHIVGASPSTYVLLHAEEKRDSESELSIGQVGNDLPADEENRDVQPF